MKDLHQPKKMVHRHFGKNPAEMKLLKLQVTGSRALKLFIKDGLTRHSAAELLPMVAAFRHLNKRKKS